MKIGRYNNLDKNNHFITYQIDKKLQLS